MQSSGRDFIIGALLIALCAASVVFLEGSTAVFVAIAAAITGAIFIIRGLQAGEPDPDTRIFGEDTLDTGVDWDNEFKRDLGGPR